MRPVLPAANPASPWAKAFRPAATAYGVLALGLALTVAAAAWVAYLVEREARHQFDVAVADGRNAIQTRIQDYADVLHGIKGLFSASQTVSRDQFQRYIDSLDIPRRYPGIQVIHYSHRVSAAQLNAFETAVRKDTSLTPGGYPDFAVKPPEKRAEYVIVHYVEPMAGNEAALGLDLGGDPVRLATLERARDTGQLAATGSIALALDPSRHPGFAVRLPIYRNGEPVASVAQRREAFTGMVSASFVVLDLMRGVLNESFLKNIHVRIHDAGLLDSVHAPAAENLMFDSDRLLKTATQGTVAPAMAIESGLDIGGRRWNITFSARQRFISASDRWQPWLVLLGGGAISLLLFALIRSLAATRERATALAATITDDLRHSEARLAAAQRMTQELIEVLPNPVFYKGTDGRYMGVNRAWEKYFGVSRDSFVGKTVFDLYPDNRELADRLHALDQELFKNPGTQEFEESLTTPDGQRRDTIYYKATFARADGSVAGLVGTIIDITERKQIEAEHARLAAIVENSNDAIFSRALDGTIQSWNAGAERMLGYTAAETIGKPIAFTLPPNRPPNLAQNNAALPRGELVVRESNRLTKDGRVIAVMTSHSPVRDSAGNIIGASVILQDISALKRAQAAAKESEERFRITFEQAEVGMVLVDLNRRYMAVNRKFTEMTGYSRQELQGMFIHDIGYPEDTGATDAQRQDLLSAKVDSVTAERRFVRKDGSVFWAMRTLSVARDEQGDPLYFVGVSEDITERKEVAERYRTTFDNAPVGIMHTDVDTDRLLHVNRKLCDMLGYTQDELLQKTTADILHPDHEGSDRGNYREKMLRGDIGSFSSERLYLRKDGSPGWVNRTLSLVRDAAGKPLYFIRVVEDITERKQAEAARASLEAQLRESQKMQAIGTLAGGIAHDFNNIIAIILGNVELARRDARDVPNALVSLEQIKLASTRARDLVRQILAFSRRQPTTRAVISLAPIVEQTAHLLRATLPARLSLEIHCKPDVPPLLADATQIQQALINLATNAMQAMPSGPGRISILLDTAMLDATLAQTHPALRALYARHPGLAVRLVVSDSGPGMDAATRERIFEPFFTTKPVGEGTGLGLSVVHGIVEGHEGAITVDSQPGQGARFTLYFPSDKALDDVSETRRNDASAAPAESANNQLHVLYIDDDPDLAFLVQRLLESRGYRVSVHTDPRSALVALRADPDAFDLVLSDYNMPSMSGLDVAREVRAIRAALPVAVVSGFIDENLQAQAAGAGVCELLFKADSVESFCDAVHRLAQSVRETRPS